MNKNLLIYVVEDNKLYHKLVVDFLQKQGLKNLKSFYNGKDCLDAIKGGERPDIVIQDYHLEDSTGIAVLQAVKKRSKTSEFIFLTANEDMEVAVNSIKYGAFDYIIKDNDIALKKVYSKIGKIAKMIELEKRNRFTRNAMTVTVIILVAIVIFVALHEFFDLFGLQNK
ncbi:response regulator [Draconibacterium sp. IB214405]|uniref:response regulator n=1 Tax=Draconibacterium sp. IB214405 TaxID=3097352 RepID=UPI002A13F3F6|nr:response regulator [Draconibacterium sp. IB214405]MDX8340956.1 response regulator [Draconibacterium sp. IB214405]